MLARVQGCDLHEGTDAVSDDVERIVGSLRRVHDELGRPTAYVGRVMSMRRTPVGIVCDLAGGQRRLADVPLAWLSPVREGDELAPGPVRAARANDDVDGDGGL